MRRCRHCLARYDPSKDIPNAHARRRCVTLRRRSAGPIRLGVPA